MIKTLARAVGLLGGVLAVSGAVWADSWNVRMHLNQPASMTSYHYVFATHFAEKAEEYTDGRFTVTIFPGAQLGRDPDAFQQMQVGAIQTAVLAFPNLVEFYRPFNVFALPFLFDSFESAARSFNGPTAAGLYADFEEQTGVKALGVFNGGFRGITNGVRRIDSVDDFAGLKIRVPGSPILIATLESLGISPVSISPGEVFTALQLRTVDGQESTVSWGYGQGFADVQSYVTETRHSVTGTGLYINADYFADLPEDVQAAVQRAATEAVAHVNAVTRQYDLDVLDLYRDAGLEVTVIPVSDLRPRVLHIWEEYADEVGGLEVIEALVAEGQG